MQWIGDQGAYEIGNIKKGTPKQNAVTLGLVRRTRNGRRLAEDHQNGLDRLMFLESRDCPDEGEDEGELASLGFASSQDH